jgi:hypothetical protein
MSRFAGVAAFPRPFPWAPLLHPGHPLGVAPGSEGPMCCVVQGVIGTVSVNPPRRHNATKSPSLGQIAGRENLRSAPSASQASCRLCHGSDRQQPPVEITILEREC